MNRQWYLFAGICCVVLHTDCVLAVEPAIKLAADLKPPVLVKADEKPIDVEGYGHAGPSVFDVDGDGVRDLVVGSFRGGFNHYRNAGTDAEPQYRPGESLVTGEMVYLFAHGCVATSPQFADFDDNPNSDLIWGSPGPDAYLFRGYGNGTFAFSNRSGAKITPTGEVLFKKEFLGKPDSSGTTADWMRMMRYAVWPFPVDWDADGDQDMLVGDNDGSIHVLINQSMRRKPRFVAALDKVAADGEPIVIGGNAAVVAADWDADGKFDLVSGCGDGSVRWFRNVGEKGDPRFTSAGYLVPPSKWNVLDALLEPGNLPVPGTRSQPAIADMNGDGKLDLLVGDFSSSRERRNDLTPEQLKEYQQAKAAFLEAAKALSAAVERLRSKFLLKFPEERFIANSLLQMPTEDLMLPGRKERWREFEEKLKVFWEEQQDQEEFRDASGVYREAYEESKRSVEPYLKPREASQDLSSEKIVPSYEIPHGFVWLYLRR